MLLNEKKNKKEPYYQMKSMKYRYYYYESMNLKVILNRCIITY